MQTYNIFLIKVCLFSVALKFSNCSLVYQHLNPHDFSFCVRKLSADSQFGCTSSSNSYGVLFRITTRNELISILEETDFPNIILMIPLSLFKIDREMNLILAKTDKVKGLIVYLNDFKEVLYEKATCPGENYNFTDAGCNSTTANLNSYNYNEYNWPFPIIMTTILSSSYSYLQDSIHKFNNRKHLPMIGIEINSFMSATRNAINCLSKNNLILNNFSPVCTPLYFTDRMFYMGKSSLTDTDKVTLVLFNTNTKSIFTGGLLASDRIWRYAAEIFAYMVKLNAALKNKKINKSSLLFAFLDGEPYDYSGSFLIINGLDSDDGLQLFKSMYLKKEHIDEVVSYEPLNSLKKDINIISKENPVLLSSVKPFAKHLPDAKLTVLKTIQSLSYVGDKILASSATYVTESEVEAYKDELYDCFDIKRDCALFKKYLNQEYLDLLNKLPTHKFPTTVSPEYFNLSVSKVLSEIGSSELGNVAKNIKSKQDCTDYDTEDQIVNAYWKYHNGSYQCVVTPRTYDIIYDEYVVDSFKEKSFPLWMKSSIEEGKSIRIFMLPSRKMELITLFLGLGVTLITYIIIELGTYFDFLRKRSTKSVSSVSSETEPSSAAN